MIASLSITNWFKLYWDWLLIPIVVLLVIGLLIYFFEKKLPKPKSDSESSKAKLSFKQAINLKTYLSAGGVAALALALPIANFLIGSIFSSKTTMVSSLTGIVLIFVSAWLLLGFAIRRGVKSGSGEVLFIIITYVIFAVAALFVLSSFVAFFPNAYVSGA